VSESAKQASELVGALDTVAARAISVTEKLTRKSLNCYAVGQVRKVMHQFSRWDSMITTATGHFAGICWWRIWWQKRSDRGIGGGARALRLSNFLIPFTASGSSNPSLAKMTLSLFAFLGPLVSLVFLLV
jgi:hypothetical protein